MSIPRASPVADELAASVSPEIEATARANRSELLALVRPSVPRYVPGFVLSLGWSIFVALIPWLVRRAIDRLLSRFGQMTIEELVRKIFLHTQAKDEPLNPSLARHVHLKPGDVVSH